MLTIEQICTNVRANCRGCEGSGIMGTETAPDGESYQAIECQYCGEILRAIRAAVAAAVTAERERCCADVCWLCADGVPIREVEKGQFYHDITDLRSPYGDRYADCDAATIYARARGGNEED